MEPELWLPHQIELDETSRSLIADVEETARRVNEYRPLPQDVVERIQEGLLGERVYSSNAIEGNTLDIRETVKILEAGHLGHAPKREEQEALNLGNAVELIQAAVEDDECYTPRLLLKVHRQILQGIADDWAGRFRDRRVMIRGATHQPPDHAHIDALVDRLMSQLRQDDDSNGVLRATWAHWALARIHPFTDGNGRIARLWQDLVLFRSNLTCAIIRPEDRREYMEALGEADVGRFNPLVQLVAQRVSMTFDKYLAEFSRKGEEVDTWAGELVGEADARIEEQRRIAYLRWSRRMEYLRSEFEFCASKISEKSSDISVQVRRFDVIDQQRWENIRSGLRTQQTGFLNLEFQRGGSMRRYFFFFGKHWWSDLDTDEEQSEIRVCLLLSESDGSGDAVRIERIPDCPIGLREVFVVGNTFVRKRLDFETNREVYDRDIPALRIAQDFMREVVLSRLS